MKLVKWHCPIKKCFIQLVYSFHLFKFIHSYFHVFIFFFFFKNVASVFDIVFLSILFRIKNRICVCFFFLYSPTHQHTGSGMKSIHFYKNSKPTNRKMIFGFCDIRVKCNNITRQASSIS